MSDYIGKEQNITVGGKNYKISRLSFGIRKQFTEWVRSRVPDPLEALAKHIEKFPANVQEKLASEALKASTKNIEVDGPEVQAMMQTTEGSVKLTQLLLEKNHHDLTEDDCFEIAEQFMVEQIEKVHAKLKAEHPDWSDEELAKAVLAEVQSKYFRPIF